MFIRPAQPPRSIVEALAISPDDRCATHLKHGSPAQCGRCGAARAANEAWHDWYKTSAEVYDIPLTLELASFELERLAVWGPHPGSPEYDDIQRRLEAPVHTFGVHGLDADSPSALVVGALLEDLRKRDFDFATYRKAYLPPFDTVDVLRRDDDGNLVSGVSAGIRDKDGGLVGFLLVVHDVPLDKPVFLFPSDRTLYERIRVRTEYVRLFCNALSFGRVPASSFGNVIRSLGYLGAFLRADVSLARIDSAQRPEYEAADPNSKGDEVSNTHAESVMDGVIEFDGLHFAEEAAAIEAEYEQPKAPRSRVAS